MFVRLLLCLQVAGGPLPQLQAIWPDTDNAFFDAWGRKIAGGDFLQREPWHPDHAWMGLVAQQALSQDADLRSKVPVDEAASTSRESRTWDLWLGGAVYFQEPAYAYLVGLTYWLFGPSPWSVFAWQLLLGVGGVLLVQRLGTRLYSRSVGITAGALAVLAPVPLFLEVTLLRDSLVVFTTLGLALLMPWAAEGPRRRWLLLGLAFGAAATVKQTFLLFPIGMATWRLSTSRSTWRARLPAVGLVVVGAAVALLPVALRNLLVGAPLLAMNGSAGAMLPIFHTAGATAHAVSVDADYVRILLGSEGRPLGSLMGAAGTHPSLWHLFGLEFDKLLQAWHSYEAPNNVDFYLFRQEASVLAFLPASIPALVPLAAVGLVKGADRAWPLVVALLCSLAGLILAAVLTRYRAPLIAGLLPLAAAGAIRLGTWLTARRWRPVFATLALGAPYLAWSVTEPRDLPAPSRAASYRRDAEGFARSAPALGAIYLRESLRLEPADPGAARRLGELLVMAGDPAGALPYLEAALRRGDAPSLRVARARALAALDREAEALAEARSAVAAEPEVPGGRALLEFLERGSDDGRAGRPEKAPP